MRRKLCLVLCLSMFFANSLGKSIILQGEPVHYMGGVPELGDGKLKVKLIVTTDLILFTSKGMSASSSTPWSAPWCFLRATRSL